MNKIFATLHMAYLLLHNFSYYFIWEYICFCFYFRYPSSNYSLVGGSGLRGSFNVGDKKQKITGFIAGVIFVSISLFWTNYTNYFVRITDLEISGPIWCFIGFLVGLLFSTKKHSENNFN